MNSYTENLTIYVPSYKVLPLSKSLAACAQLLPLTLGLSNSNGSENPVFRCDSREDHVETELGLRMPLDGTAVVVSTTDRVRKGFSIALPRWLSVRVAAPAALCKGARVGRVGRCRGGEEASSSFSSGGVRKGSSGGFCWTMGSEVAER